MTQNPVEENFVTRFLLGLAVIFAMTIGGGAVGTTFSDVGLPYGAWIGVAVGAIAVFVAFAALYGRYDASYTSD